MELKPFKAYRFDNQVVGNAGDCIAPPYDVIDPQMQQQLYEKNDYNIARIIKGKQNPTDTETDNQYTRAAEYLNKWIESGAIKQDSEDAIYAYVQDFEITGTRYKRLSFISLTKLQQFGSGVKAHEKILNKPIEDRLNLNRATNAKFGLVFMLYDDPDKIAEQIIEKTSQTEPLIQFTDEQNVTHELYAITDKTEIEAITNMMADKNCVIADGHHRYTTALNYAKENPNPMAQYQMISFANVRHEGLIVLATHRVAKNLENFDTDKLLADLKRFRHLRISLR